MNCFSSHDAATKASCKDLVDSAWPACNGFMLVKVVILCWVNPANIESQYDAKEVSVEIEFNSVE